MSIRVLIVEDDPDTADAIRTVLAHWGHEVCIARDGATGIDLAARFRPDVAMLDLSLPDIDGFAFLAGVQFRRRLTADEMRGLAQV